MIEGKLLQAFDAQIAETNAAIGAARQALSACEDRSEVRIGQHRIVLLENFVKAIEGALAAIIVADGERQAGERKFARWSELQPLVRAAMDEKEKLEKEFPGLEYQLSLAQGKVGGAVSLLRQAIDSQLKDSDYPTAKELRQERAELDKLERLQQAALANANAAAAARDQCRSEWLKASAKLSGLQFQERMVRPPEPQPEQTQVLFAVR